jgi:ubiquinone/menaquinone biosynthesis C-methylase UbiE
MPHCAHWELNLRRALHNRPTRRFVDRALRDGYRNMLLPEADRLADRIFTHLDASGVSPIGERLDWIRNNLSNKWCGVSVRDFWSDYYRDVEAPFITNIVAEHIRGNELLEVGTGRGWIAHHLVRKLGTDLCITQTDVSDYREDEIRTHPQLRFVAVPPDNPFPFEPGSFDTAIIIYVLHHVPGGSQWQTFIERAMRAVRHRLIILEDTYLGRHEVEALRFDQMPAFEQFLDLSPEQQQWALSFLCTLSNRVDGGGAQVPTPCTFKHYERLRADLRMFLRPSQFHSEFLGIPKSKVYLNAETFIVIDK